MHKPCLNCDNLMREGGVCSYCGHREDGEFCDCQACDESREMVAEEAELREGGVGS